MPPAEDIALMASVSSGDREARERVVRRLMQRVQRLCRALIRNASDAGDASQASLVEILRSASTYRGESSIERWADRVAARTALRWVTSERRKRGVPVLTDGEPLIAQSEGQSRLVRECLAVLSEPQRTTLLLRCQFEYSVEEIAELTGVSPNTVKDRLLRSRGLLRRLLREELSLELTPARG